MSQKDNRRTVKEQFGANAGDYVHSKTHAAGYSLTRMGELLTARPHWQVLDIATAAGHAAFVFAAQVAQVTAVDITPEMLPLAQAGAAKRGLANVVTELADAEALPYADGTFHLVTCRIAPHHFPHPDRFVRQAARVLRPNGRFLLVDNIVPADEGGAFVNAFEKKRDPSHYRALSAAEWTGLLREAGLTVEHAEKLGKHVHFNTWTKRHDEDTRRELRHMLLHEANPSAQTFLRPEETADGLHFYLQEGIFIGRKPAN